MYYLTGSRDSERYRTEFLDCYKAVDDALVSCAGSKGFFLGERVSIGER